MAQENNDEEKDNFFDEELEGILRATSDISVTDNSPKEIGLKPPKEKTSVTQSLNVEHQLIQQRTYVPTSKVENTIKEILSRKEKISLKSSIVLQVYDKKTLKFLSDLFDKDLKQEEIIDIIINSIDMTEVKNSIKDTLIEYYNKNSQGSKITG